MIEGFIIAGIIMWIGSKLSPGWRVTARFLIFIVILFPLIAILWHVGVFKMLSEMIIMIFGSVFEIIGLLFSQALFLIF